MNVRLYLLLFFFQQLAYAQYPQYVVLNDENGAPSNEIYSIVQDPKGFVWIGCEAGLFKFDGVRYIPYKCPQQKASAITGLTISSAGTLYCYNFQSQIFMLHNDSLKAIKVLFPAKITSIARQNKGLILVHHSAGMSIYHENTNTWQTFGTQDAEQAIGTNVFVTKGANHHPKDTVWYITYEGIASYHNGQRQLFKSEIFKNQSPGLFQLEYHANKLWILSAEKNKIFTFAKNQLKELSSENLRQVLRNRTITNMESLPDGKLWICTYTGLIAYDEKNDRATLFYPKKSFSDCMIDREGTYWFSTLQEGLLRMPNIQMLVWNADNQQIRNGKISNITYGDGCIYFATIDGCIGTLDIASHSLQTFQTGSHGDVQSFDYDTQTKTLRFNINNILFSLQGNTLSKKPIGIKALKTMRQIGRDVFIGSSHGLYINNNVIKVRWITEIENKQGSATVWVSSNDGLLKLVKQDSGWTLQKTLFEGVQILSIHLDSGSNILYALTFNGKLYAIDESSKSTFVAEIPSNVQAVQIESANGMLYLATNIGLWIYSLQEKKWETLTKLSGIASDNIQGLALSNETIWLATGRGLQQIPLTKTQYKKSSIVYLKIIVAGHTTTHLTSNLGLQYGESLTLFPEATAYNSSTHFQYAYQIKSSDTNWIKLPSSIEQIEIKNMPPGPFEIMVKVIDHLGMDSENTIQLSGNVKPPFWKSNWFFLIILLAAALLIYVILSMRLRKMRQSQQREIERIQLENELRLSRETALKSQMNPHFIFNVLNSIKAYIYKNDKQKASEYLNDFSALIRTFLNMSHKTNISLHEELNLLKLYIHLEAMLLKEDFNYEMHVDERIDLMQTFIPSLILQPLVENAFKHGLHHKKGNKQLSIHVSIKDGKLHIEITDNGIGRTASYELQQNNRTEHHSFAGMAIEKRIALLNKDTKIVDLEVSDLYANEVATGTKVLIKIEINE